MGLGLGWAVIVSRLMGVTLAPELNPTAGAIITRSSAIAAATQPITLLDSLLAFSYLAFFFAFVDAHYRAAKGLTPEGTPIVLSQPSRSAH